MFQPTRFFQPQNRADTTCRFRISLLNALKFREELNLQNVTPFEGVGPETEHKCAMEQQKTLNERGFSFIRPRVPGFSRTLEPGRLADLRHWTTPRNRRQAKERRRNLVHRKLFSSPQYVCANFHGPTRENVVNSGCSNFESLNFGVKTSRRVSQPDGTSFFPGGHQYLRE